MKLNKDMVFAVALKKPRVAAVADKLLRKANQGMLQAIRL